MLLCAAALKGRLVAADSAAVEHKRMHAYLRQVNDGLVCEAQELHDELEGLRGHCERHAVAVRALEVGRARIAHGL
jgi:hypothetical protein